jgi:diacylglycerol O-acyltransferase / wax synthase
MIETTNERAWASVAAWGAEPEMNELEALMWRSERHPRLSSTVTIVELLDRIPEWERFHAGYEWATSLVPRFRQRVVEPALPLAPPRWAIDPDFELDRHVRREVLPAPGAMRQVLDCAQTRALAPLDRSRPLWEATLVEGFEEGRAAHVLKLHHSLTDGLGSIQLLGRLHSRTREPSPDKPGVAPPPADQPSTAALTAEQLAARGRSVPGIAVRLLTTAARAAGDPATAAADALRMAGSARRVLAGPPAEPSPVLQPRRGDDWRFCVMECGLDELKAAGRAGGGSVNDAFVAALLGGLRRYHEHLGTPLDEVPMAMPVSIRRHDDPMGGNRFTGALFAAPMGTADPAERIAAVRGVVLSVRAEPALDILGAVSPLVNRAPSALGALALGSLGSSADISASNVPGIPFPVYAAGARVDRVFAFGPLPGVAMIAALVSHVGTCCIGINFDGAAISAPDRFTTCLNEGLREVLALG